MRRHVRTLSAIWIAAVATAAMSGCLKTRLTPQLIEDPPVTMQPAEPGPPAPPPDDRPLLERRFETPEEAGLAAMIATDNLFRPAVAELNRTATRALLTEQVWRQADLNDDGLEELILDLGRWVRTTGGPGASGDAIGNRPWVLIQLLPDGWRIIHRGYGSDIATLDTNHNGWRDLSVNFRTSVGGGSVALQQFDGQRYRTAWGLPVIGMNDGYRAMTAAPIPDDVLLRIVHDIGPTPPTRAQVISGAAFRADLDGDGADELLVQVDKAVVDDRTVSLRGTQSPGNLYLFTRRDDQWQHVLRAINDGPLRMPLAVAADDVILLEVQTGTSGPQVLLEWFHVRYGQIIATGTRRRLER